MHSTETPPQTEFPELPIGDKALLTRLVKGLVRAENRDAVGNPATIMICDLGEEIIVDSKDAVSDDHVKGISGYVTRILVACDENTIFLVPDLYADLARALARQFTEMGLSTFKEENVVPIALTPGKGFMESVEEDLAGEESPLKGTLTEKLRVQGKRLDQALTLPFIQTENSKRVETLLGTYPWQNPELVTRMNDKGHFGTEIEGVASTVSCRNADELLAKLDVDTLATEFELGSRESVDIFLKGNRSASGAAVVRFQLTRANQELLKAVLRGENAVPSNFAEDFKDIFKDENLKYLRSGMESHGVSIQHSLTDMPGVDRFYESDGVNFWIGETDEDTMIMGHSLQYLNGNVHLGNEGPLPLWMRSKKTRSLVSKAVRQMKDKGYRGPGGFDLFVGVRAGVSFENLESYEGDIDDALVSYLGECNGRFTGQSHGNIAAAQLGAEQWMTNNNVYFEGVEEGTPVNEVLSTLRERLAAVGLDLNPTQGRESGMAVVNIVGNKAMVLALRRGPAPVGESIQNFWERIKAAVNVVQVPTAVPLALAAASA